MEHASLLNEVRHSKQRFITLCYRVQESRLRLAQSLTNFNDAHPRMNRDCVHHDFSALPLYAFVTATNGVRNIVRQAAMVGGAVHDDEAANGLTFTQQYRNGLVVLAVAGDLDLATVSSFRRRLKSMAEATGNLLLDFSQLRYIDSTGIHALLDVCQTLALAGRRMALAAISAHVQRVLTVFGIDGIFPIFSTVETAVVAFGTEVPRGQLSDAARMRR